VSKQAETKQHGWKASGVGGRGVATSGVGGRDEASRFEKRGGGRDVI